MINSIYLLVTLQFEDSISKVFQSLGRKYVQYFNHTLHRSRRLWDGCYRVTVVDTEQYLFKVMCFVKLNPVRANTTTHPADYYWNSYALNAKGKSEINVD